MAKTKKSNRPNRDDLLSPTVFGPRKTINKWLKALRSGKYKQAKGTLYSEAKNGYCCLGVLQVCLGDVEKHLGLPSGRWLALHDVRFLDAEGGYGTDPALSKTGLTASNLNDDYKKGFKYIADLIERRTEYTD